MKGEDAEAQIVRFLEPAPERVSPRTKHYFNSYHFSLHIKRWYPCDQPWIKFIPVPLYDITSLLSEVITYHFFARVAISRIKGRNPKIPKIHVTRGLPRLPKTMRRIPKMTRSLPKTTRSLPKMARSSKVHSFEILYQKFVSKNDINLLTCDNLYIIPHSKYTNSHGIPYRMFSPVPKYSQFSRVTETCIPGLKTASHI